MMSYMKGGHLDSQLARYVRRSASISQAGGLGDDAFVPCKDAA